MKRYFLSFFLLVFPFIHGFSFGTEGHHIVAEIAFSRLSESAKENVMKYLGATTIEEASVWMDDMRSHAEYNFMRPWHYLDIEKGESYKPTSDENIVNELGIVMNELKHKNTVCGDQVKKDIEILIHLTGDLHQPLHTGYPEDRGGNTVEINFLGDATNLHWVWDTKIIENQKITKESCLQLAQTLSKEQISKIQNIDVIQWMNESRSYLDDVYDFTGHVLGEAYAQKNAPILQQQLVYAGLRLAAVLEQDFGNPAETTQPVTETKTLTPVAVSGNEITAEEASKYPGETKTVCGKVFGTKFLDHSNGTPTFINMGAAYPNSPFTLVIFGSDRSNFKYKPENFLNGKDICVTGAIKMYKDKPEIVVSNQSQISISK